MASPSYSKSVLVGLQKSGVMATDVAKFAKMSEAKMRSVLSGKSGFTDPQLSAIEAATGISAGEFAMASVTPDKALKSVMTAWGDLMRTGQKRTRRVRRQSA